MYSINPDKVNNLDEFGKSIASMCRRVPTYMAEEVRGEWSTYCALQVSAGGIVRLFSSVSTKDTNYSEMVIKAKTHGALAPCYALFHMIYVCEPACS